MENYILKNWEHIFSKNNILEDIKNILKKINNFDDIYPKKEDIFKVFELIKPNKIKVVIIGQDPYHQPLQANGIAFSTSNNVKTPPSLKNIFKELKNDLGIDHFSNNDLSGWVKQGVFLINTCLTVVRNKPNSHNHLGWSQVILKILNEINKTNKDIVYCLWGNEAKKIYNNLEYISEIEEISSAHPSPFSFKKGFENSKPFSKINNLLLISNKDIIDWNK